MIALTTYHGDPQIKAKAAAYTREANRLIAALEARA